MTAVLSHPRYRLDRLVATGGMGEVWAATDTLLEREVAVKLLKREYADDPVFRARFAAEARHAGALQHPHVAAVLDYGELPGEDRSPVPFLVMELVEGRPLSALLTGGRALEPALAAELIAQAAEGLAAAHAIGIVHRDVKPGNLLVTGDGKVKVTDFGIAQAADAVPLTMTGHVVGTPHYFSPEQAQGHAATPASDVYSLGIVLFECLVGDKPFVGDSPVATALMQLRDPLPPFPPGVPERLQAVVLAATAKDPAKRIRGAAELAAALRSADRGTRSLELPAAAGATAAPAAGSTAGEYVVRRRVPWLLLAGLLAVALVVGGAVALTAGRGDEPASEPTPAVAPELVRVRAAAYVGLPVVEAARRLRSLGLDVRTVLRANPGGKPAATVAAVDPTGMVERGTEVILTIWREPASAPPAAGERPAGEAGGDPTLAEAGPGATHREEQRAEPGGDQPGDQGAPGAGRSDHTGTPDHTGRPDHAGQPGKPDHAGGPGNSNGPGKGKPDKGTPDRGTPGKGKPDKGGKG